MAAHGKEGRPGGSVRGVEQACVACTSVCAHTQVEVWEHLGNCCGASSASEASAKQQATAALGLDNITVMNGRALAPQLGLLQTNKGLHATAGMYTTYRAASVERAGSRDTTVAPILQAASTATTCSTSLPSHTASLVPFLYPNSSRPAAKALTLVWGKVESL